MQLAHTLGEGGPEIEFLMVAAAMLVLGIVFFVQKTVKPAVPVVLVVGALAMVAGAFAAGGDPGGSAEGASVQIVAPEDGTTVPSGEPFELEIDLQNAPEGGHFDVRVDDELESMGPTPAPVTFETGEHTLTVEYVNSRHQSFSPPLRDVATVTGE